MKFTSPTCSWEFHVGNEHDGKQVEVEDEHACIDPSGADKQVANSYNKSENVEKYTYSVDNNILVCYNGGGQLLGRYDGGPSRGTPDKWNPFYYSHKYDKDYFAPVGHMLRGMMNPDTYSIRVHDGDLGGDISGRTARKFCLVMAGRINKWKSQLAGTQVSGTVNTDENSMNGEPEEDDEEQDNSWTLGPMSAPKQNINGFRESLKAEDFWDLNQENSGYLPQFGMKDGTEKKSPRRMNTLVPKVPGSASDISFDSIDEGWGSVPYP